MSRQPLRNAILDATEQLAAVGVASARADAEVLAAHLLGVPRTRLALVPLVEPEILAGYRTMVEQRAKHVPLQYITGVSAMGSIDVEVGPGVFVPRPETELLLAWALAYLAADAPRPPLVLDLCTGSGALALAIANSRPDASVHAVELAPRALEWARRNAELRAGAGDAPITLHAGDVTDPALLGSLDAAVHVVVANPPYIPDGTRLEPEVAEHDPPEALFAGADGLDVIEPMIANIARWLAPGGAAAVEHDDGNGAQVASLFRAAGFVDVAEHPDLTGRPRFVVAHRARMVE